MRATQFEFKYRFWIFGLIFFLGFSLYSVDGVNSGNAILHLFAPAIDPNSAAGNNLMRLIFGVATVLIAGAALYRTWAAAYLHAEVVHDTRQHSDRVVADGPYRYTRNPLYFANLFLALGCGFTASRLGLLFMVLAMAFFDHRLILREEASLRESQGDAYARYLAAVPRLLPSLRPRLEASGARPRWGQAFLGESMFWMFALGSLFFAITLNLKIAGPLFVLSYFLYFAAIYAIKKRAVRRA
jgi:protein-S-isoprenylcysteine O-methyltransferase Ste14